MDLKNILGEELAAQVEEKLGDKKLLVNDGNYIPKGKFDDLNTEKNTYKAQLEERDRQLEDLKKKAAGNEDLAKQLEDLQNQNKQSSDEYESKLAEQKKDFAIETAILKAKAKNPKAVKALLDASKVEHKDNKLYGLDEQLAELKKSDSYLFGDERATDSANPPPDQKKTAKDEYNEVLADVRKNPNDQALKQKLFILKSRLNE